MPEPIHIVSGLPRSGTSLMMSMLEAGGLTPLVDAHRPADEDNPKGYYELEDVKRLDRDAGFVPAARGHVVKVISELLRHLPEGERYRVVFMRRDLDEVLASQRRMLERRKEPVPSDEAQAELRRGFILHIEEVEALVRSRDDMEVLWISYNRLMSDPERMAERVQGFLQRELDVGAMIARVDPSLYRQRVMRS